MQFQVPVLASFRRQFGEPAVVVRSPGRVNLIGEHTDYNHGFVLPAAVDRGIAMALRPRSDRRYVLHALDLDRRLEGDLERIGAPSRALAQLSAGCPRSTAEGRTIFGRLRAGVRRRSANRRRHEQQCCPGVRSRLRPERTLWLGSRSPHPGETVTGGGAHLRGRQVRHNGPDGEPDEPRRTI